MAEENTMEMKTEFTTEQQKEISEGTLAGIDTSAYAKPEFLAIQMRQIRLALMEGLDVSSFADPAFDWQQMEEIRQGLKGKLDVSKYADPRTDYLKMRQLRFCLEEGIDIAPFARKRADVINEVRVAKKAGIDILPFVEQNYDAGQLEQIRLAFEHHVDIVPFLNIDYRGVSLEEIRIGLEKGFDVTVYADISYDWRQMRELRLGMEANIDTSLYSNPLYSYRQMKEIRKGIESGLPVDSYRKLRFSATDMREKRIRLLKEMKEKENQGNSLGARDFSAKIFEGNINTVNTGEDLRVLISPDEMEVHIMLNNLEERPTEEKILHALWTSKIRKGILRKEIQKVATGVYKERSVLVAVGQNPRAGKDGWYEYFFRTDVSRKPKVLEDGSVDYQNIEWFDEVKEGAKLAVYHPAEDGVDGYTVKGEVLPSMKGKEQGVLSGDGIRYVPEEKTYYSTVSGWVELKGSRLDVSSMLIVKETNIATGNIVFNGNVYVKGNVGSRSEIHATGDIIVDGFVEDAIIEAGGSVMLKRGMNATGKGHVMAGKDVSGKFFEASRVYAGGSIKVDYVLHSELESEDTVEITKYSGAIVGGSIMATRGVIAQNVGNAAGVKTYVKVGANKRLLDRIEDIKKRTAVAQEELKILEDAKRELERKFSMEILSKMDMYSKCENAIYTENKKLEEIEAERRAAEEEMKLVSTAKIVIRGNLYEGTTIDINGKLWNANDMRNITIRGTSEEKLAFDKNE